MKKLLVFAVMFALAPMAFVQYFAGGLLGYSTTSIKDINGDKQSTDFYNASVMLGRNISKKWDLGLELGVSHNKESQTGADDVKATGYNVTPFVRYNVWGYEKFNIYVRAQAGYGRLETSSAGYKETWDGFDIAIVPEIQYNLSERIALFSYLDFASINYHYASASGGRHASTFNIGADSRNVISVIGMYYKF